MPKPGTAAFTATTSGTIAETQTAESQLRQCVNELLRDIDLLREDLKHGSPQTNDDLIGWCDTTIENVKFEYGEAL